MRSPINWHKIWFTYTTKRITKLKRIGQMVVTLDLEWRDVIPGAPYLTQFFTEKDEKVNKTDWQNKWSVKMCLLAVLAYRNSFINDKVNHSNIFLAGRKKKETNQELKKLTTFFTKKPHSKPNVTQKSCTFHDILTTLLSRCCKVLSFFSTFSAGFLVWEFSVNHEQHCYETALVPCIASSKILQTCVITSRDVTVLRSWLENSNWPDECPVPTETTGHI